MNELFQKFVCLLAMILLAGCWVDTKSIAHPKPSVSGLISGTVVDSWQQPVSGVTVRGISTRDWTVGPLANTYVTPTVVTDASGKFVVKTSIAINSLTASSPNGWGELKYVTQTGNIIVFKSKAELGIRK